MDLLFTALDEKGDTSEHDVIELLGYINENFSYEYSEVVNTLGGLGGKTLGLFTRMRML